MWTETLHRDARFFDLSTWIPDEFLLTWLPDEVTDEVVRPPAPIEGHPVVVDDDVVADDDTDSVVAHTDAGTGSTGSKGNSSSPAATAAAREQEDVVMKDVSGELSLPASDKLPLPVSDEPPWPVSEAEGSNTGRNVRPRLG
jgi:hypothetical protein